MRRFLKGLLVFVLTVMLCSSAFMINAFAAGTTTVAFSDNSPKVGDKVTIIVKLNAGEAVYSVDGTVTFNTSVLKYVSGASSASGGTLRFVDSFAGEKTISYNVVFSVIAEGTSNIAFSAKYVGESLAMTSAVGSSANLVVKSKAPVTSVTPPQTSSKPVSSKPVVTQKSSNANLLSLSVNGMALTPKFSKDVTEYSLTLENSFEKVKISAQAESGKASVGGLGEVSLKVGENPCEVIVTAEDGTKKTYSIKIKRATVEESVALNPLVTVIDGKMHHIVPTLDDTPVPAGFKAGKTYYNNKEIEVFESEDLTLKLFKISRDEDKYTDYYTYVDYRDEFVKLNYITVNNEMYILEAFPEGFVAPKGYYEATVTLGGESVTAFCSENEILKDFYVIYCYANGTRGFYRFDTLTTKIQRAPDFGVEISEGDKPFPESLEELTKLEMYLGLAVVLLFVIVIVLVILLMVKGKKRKKQKYSSESPITLEDMDEYFRGFSETKK